MPGAAKYRITSYQWFNDDGEEDASTSVAAINTSADLEVDTPYQLRIGVDNWGGSSNDVDAQLQRNLGGAGFGDVTGASTIVQATAGAYVTDGEPTDERLNQGATFVAGECENANGATGTVTVGDTEETEFLFVITIVSGDVSDNDTITFDLVEIIGIAYTAALEEPTCTVNKVTTVNVNCTFGGTINLTKYNATVVEGIDVACAFGGTAQLSKYNPTVLPTIVVACTFPAAVQMAPYNPTVLVTTTIDCSTATMTMSSFNATVEPFTAINCTFPASVDMTVYAAEVEVGTTIDCSFPTMQLTKYNASVSAAVTVDCSFPAPVDLSPYNPEVEEGTTINVSWPTYV
jgi:hypothetical protein